MQQPLAWIVGITVAAASTLVVYSLLARSGDQLRIVFPPIGVLIEAWIANAGQLRAEAMTSIESSVLGLIVGTLVGFLGSLLVRLVAPMDYVVTPIAIAAKATPIVAISPFLAVFLRGNSYLVPFASSVLISFFPVYVLCRRGLNRQLRSLAEYGDTLRWGRLRRLATLDLPGAVALSGAAMQSAAPLSVVGALVGEMMVGAKGLGFLVVRHQNASNFPALYCTIVATCIVGLIFFAFGSLIAFVVMRYIGVTPED